MIKERTVRIADNLILKLVRHTERGMIVMWGGMSDCRVFFVNQVPSTALRGLELR